jgi:hypothetical protein
VEQNATGTGTRGPLAPLYGKFPHWEAWVGVAGLLYARRRKSTPAVVFRAGTAEELAAKITEYETAHGDTQSEARN